MIRILLEKRQQKKISWMLLSIMLLELITPTIASALSSGPVQPEISSFEPVGTTDMVDLFTGDFVYNIPLMDVEGYPINISYHGGVTMDQEASWVGLGWNINPGAINRAVRGLPDEFNGETIEKEMNIKPEVNKKIGLEGGVELLGMGDPNISIGASLGGYLNISNYRGVSVDFTASAGVNTKLLMISAGLNVGASIGSQAGASIDYGANVGIGASQTVSKDMAASGSFNLNYGGTYSPRTGLRRNVGFSAGLNVGQKSTGNSVSMSTGTSVPIGTQNYTAAITNASYMNTIGGQLKLGGEVFGAFLNGKCAGTITTIKYDPDGSRAGYGFFNLANATDADLLDFSREKDGMYNTTMQLLPQSHLTYDVYSVSGQGTGGSFRPFRNDIGSVYDPVTTSKQNSENFGVEAGVGNGFELGGEGVFSKTSSESGPWKTSDCYRKFKGKKAGYFEDIYFKEAGELTANNESYLNAYANNTPVTPEQVKAMPDIKTGADTRIVRANHIYTVSAAQADTALLLDNKQIISYKDTTGFKTYPVVHKDTIVRSLADATKQLRRKDNHVTEIVQTQKDGRRYVYGLPVVNNVQREATFAVDTTSTDNPVDMARYLVGYAAGSDDSKNNSKGLDNFYSSTVTPTYTTAHLLTSVLSADYIDVTGNGISDDDLGTYTKFNYSRKSADYRWRSPIQSGKAQYMPGYKIDRRDDKASYIIGSREQWMLHSIETKNYVAEFYVSPRKDALGVLDQIIGAGSAYQQAPYNTALSANTKDNKSYKLDSIVLYNKHDRYINAATAQPIKTVIFTYDYSLCKNVPNAAADSGKLTLKKIQVRYGTSNLNMSAAYNFKYSDTNPNYDDAAKDRWGMYKPNGTPLNNLEFPFTTQSSAINDYASAWSLTEIDLPSGGVIKVDYESDDYAYVQNKEAMEMFKIQGFGNSNVYKPTDQLYFSTDNPNLYFYFKRRTESENSLLSPWDNYLKGTSLLYYNIPTELAPNGLEPIKGYAQVDGVGYCPDGVNGYVKVAFRTLTGSGEKVNPVTYAALNVGRYSLPQFLFPGSDPDGTDVDNIVAGLKSAIKEMFEMNANPLSSMINANKAKRADYTRSFMRLTSPGLMKKGGGQRVKSLRFYDSWDAMAGGNQAVYGKNYAYTLTRDDGKGTISSGVASYEPMIGGDELPQRVPVGYTAQAGNSFPPNDPVDLYQELPIGESFYPGPVVGYSNVVVTSINKDQGRSSQTEDISGFYTAKDFPIQAVASPINSPSPTKDISITDITIDQQTTQGFALVFNDMHGKPRNTEHWLLKPADTVNGRELLNMQSYQYLTQAGQLDNMVPVFDYDPGAGKMSVAKHKMGIETDLSIDSRMRHEVTTTGNISANLNAFTIPFPPFLLPIPLGYPFEYTNTIDFECATVTKITQQYGILGKVISNNEGAVTEVRNEVFDQYTGNALVTSVNNEFNDREYNVSYPAYWAYKELGPCYQNHDVTGTFSNKMLIDSLGPEYIKRFTNYNPFFSTHYLLPSNMPVARIQIDEQMPNFKLGDEMLVYTDQSNVPIKTWTMGYTSDTLHCYLILANREPYKTGGLWTIGNNYSNVSYRVIRSGNKNRLGETIQSYTTADSTNIFPFLKDDLTNLINLNAQTYKYNLNQVYAANQTSDSLNPFTTGKVGMYRPEQQILNLRNRTYVGGTTRNAGVYNSASYWQTELDNYAGYCPDSIVGSLCGAYPPSGFTGQVLDSIRFNYLGGDSISATIFFPASANFVGCNDVFWFQRFDEPLPLARNTFSSLTLTHTTTTSFGTVVLHGAWTVPQLLRFNTVGGCSCMSFYVSYDGSHFTINRNDYKYSGGPMPAFFTDVFVNAGLIYGGTPGGYVITPYRIRKKILIGNVGHYDGDDDENWVKTQQVTKYNWFGQELENKEEGIGYNSAIYGYNQQLPVCVAKNARHNEVLFEGFEDYALLKARPDQNASYMPLLYSPFEPFFGTTSNLDSFYKVGTLSGSSGAVISKDDAHTGTYSLKVSSSFSTPLNATDPGMASGYSFKMFAPRKYVASLWLKPTTAITDARTGYTPNGVYISMDSVLGSGSGGSSVRNINLTAKSNIIDGWQKFEVTFDAPPGYLNFQLQLAGGYYYDDIRLYPFESNSKGFVYDRVTRKLMATLDENNYATFYEYDAEGNLVRTKRETEKGILTITESRSTHHKSN